MKPLVSLTAYSRRTLFVAGLALAGITATVTPVRQATAHGAVGYPIARQYQCRLEEGYWYPEDGSAIPQADCRSAFHAGNLSAYPFTQWNEVSANPVGQGDDMEHLKAAVPDGLLCAGGDRNKAGLDVPSATWRRTRLAPKNGHVELVWENTQSHNPARMRVFISKPSYNPTQPLRWEDLQQIYDEAAPAPQPASGAGHLPGTVQSFYKLDVTLPPGRTGDAVIYSYWQRKDAGNEGFFNCSDVSIAPSENIASFPWIDDGSFVQPGFRAQAGEQVRFRVMGGASSGKEVVDVRHPVTEHDADPAVWAKQMADQVNRQYGSVVRIGVRSGNTIDFDAAHPEANKIWLKPDYSSSLSLIGRD